MIDQNTVKCKYNSNDNKISPSMNYQGSKKKKHFKIIYFNTIEAVYENVRIKQMVSF